MASFNKVILMGNLTRNPALKYTASNKEVCEFGLAVNRRFGDDKEEVIFVDVLAWGKLAETCNKYLEKGNPVLIDGRLQLDQWEDKNTGQKRSRLRVVAEKVEFMRGNSEASESTTESTYQEPQEPQVSEENEDDIPF